MTAWITIVAAGIAVFALRALLLLGRRLRLPASFERRLDLVAPAALAALAAPALVTGAGGGVPIVLPRAAALAVGVVVAHRSRSIGATVTGGMAVLWLATAACHGVS